MDNDNTYNETEDHKRLFSSFNANNFFFKLQGAVYWCQTNFGEGGVWPGIIDMATSIFNSQWGEGGTWEGNMKNLQAIGQLLVDWWQLSWGEDGIWAGIMDFARDKFNEMWGEDGIWEGIMDNIKTAIGLVKDKFEEQIDKISARVLVAKDFVMGLYDAIRDFWNWLKDKVFEIIINWDKVPEWLIPHSPIPIHTAMQDFDRFLKQTSFDVDMATNGLESVGSSMLDRTALATAGAQVNQPFNMYGSVNTGMNERELETKVRRWIRDENRKR